MNFSVIPEEIKLKIFSYFTTKEVSRCLAPVCREWWTLSKEPSLCKRLELNIYPHKSPDVYRQVIARWSLTSLTLHTVTQRNELSIYIRNINLRNLKELDLRGWRYIHNCEIFSIVSNSPNLEILSLRVKSGTCGLEHICNLKNLKSLTVSSHVFQKVYRPDLELIVRVCTKLEALILQILDRFDDQFLVQLADYRKDTLKHLILPRDYLTADGMRVLTSCQNLSTLCMKGRVCFLSNEIFAILSTMPKLKWLDLGGTVCTEQQNWKNFLRCPNLSSLNILEISGTDIDDSGVVSLALTCKQLVILDLSRNYKLRDGGVQAVIDNCSHLWFLDVSSTQVTRNILPYIPTKLPLLKYLNVQICSQIDETDVKKFTLTCPRVEVRNKFGGPHVEYTVDEKLNLKWRSSMYFRGDVQDYNVFYDEF